MHIAKENVLSLVGELVMGLYGLQNNSLSKQDLFLDAQLFVFIHLEQFYTDGIQFPKDWCSAGCYSVLNYRKQQQTMQDTTLTSLPGSYEFGKVCVESHSFVGGGEESAY